MSAGRPALAPLLCLALCSCVDDFDRFVVCTPEAMNDPRCPRDGGNPDACMPDCSGKPCGASDGCRGLCDGACPTGQRCVSAQCTCDEMSCGAGCCAQNQCASGGADTACGVGGVMCASCSSMQVCSKQSCTECGKPGEPCCSGGNCDPSLGVCSASVCVSRNVWAVGYDSAQGLATHWDGSAWSTPMSVPGTNYLLGMFGFGGNDVWAVGGSGSQGAVAHWNGSSWTSNTVAGVAQIRSIWGTDLSNFWAVGRTSGGSSQGAILNYGTNTASFSLFATIAGTVTLADIWGTGPNDIWAVGGTTAAHWNGSAWSPMSVGCGLSGVSGSSSNDIWAVGSDSNSHACAIHWNGSTWSSAMTFTNVSRLERIWAQGPNDVWTGGPAVVIHWDGNSWTSTPIGGDIGALWASGPNDVWVTGSTTQGVAFHWNGSAWSSAFTFPTVLDLQGVWGVAR